MALVKTLRFNEGDIEEPVERIYRPGAKIDVVFEIDSLSPLVRPSIILDCDYREQKVTFAQTRPPIVSSDARKQTDIATLHGKNLRVGLPCKIVKFLKDYQLSDKRTIPAVMAKYTLPMNKVSIRSSFRLEPNPAYKIFGQFTYKDFEYKSGKQFSIQNLSLTGAGLLVPKVKMTGILPLLGMEKGEKVKAAYVLVDEEAGEAEKKVITVVQELVRKNLHFNDRLALQGYKILAINRADEAVLSAFIHRAQLYSIREMRI